MGQLVLWGYVYLVGLAFVTACGWARRPAIGCALALPAGLVSWGFALAVPLWLGLPLSAAVAVAAIALLAATGGAAWRRRAELGERAVAIAAIGLTAVVAIAAAATAFWPAVAEPEHSVYAAGEALQGGSEWLDLVWDDVPSPPVFRTVLHAAAPVLGGRFLAALAPLCALGSVVLLSLGGAAVAGRWLTRPNGRVFVGACLAVSGGAFVVAVQAAAVDLHAQAALFLIGFIVAHTLGEESDAPDSVSVELALLFGFAVQGFAFTALAAAFLLIAYDNSRRSGAVLTRSVSVYTAIATLWHLSLWQSIRDWGTATTVTDALVVSAATPFACVCLQLSGPTRSRATGRARASVAAAVVLGAGVAVGSLAAAALPAVLLMALAVIRLTAGPRAEARRRDERASEQAVASPGARGNASARTGKRPRYAGSAAGLFAAVVALLLFTNIRELVRGQRRIVDGNRKVFSIGPDSFASDRLAFVYYLLGDAIPGTTVVIPERLAHHALFFRVLGRVAVEVSRDPLRLSSVGAREVAPLRSGFGRLYYESARNTELVSIVLSPESRRYVLAESEAGRLHLLPDSLYDRFADRPARRAPAGTAP